MKATKVEKLAAWVERTATAAQHEIDNFANRFEESPFSAFEWSKETFRAAAELLFAQSLRVALATAESKNVDLFETIERLTEDAVLQGAAFPEYSTSPQANLVKTELVAARARLLRDMKFW